MRVRIEFDSRRERIASRFGAAILAAAAVSVPVVLYAALPVPSGALVTFHPGDVISSSAINGNFSTLANAIDSTCGDLALLSTPAPNLVTAINAVNANIPNAIKSTCGDLTLLSTPAPNLVTAINAVNANIPSAIKSTCGDLTLLSTPAPNLVGAINAVNANIPSAIKSTCGDLTLLSTPAPNLVAAINAVDAKIPTGTSNVMHDTSLTGQGTTASPLAVNPAGTALDTRYLKLSGGTLTGGLFGISGNFTGATGSPGGDALVGVGGATPSGTGGRGIVVTGGSTGGGGGNGGDAIDATRGTGTLAQGLAGNFHGNVVMDGNINQAPLSAGTLTITGANSPAVPVTNGSHALVTTGGTGSLSIGTVDAGTGGEGADITGGNGGTFLGTSSSLSGGQGGFGLNLFGGPGGHGTGANGGAGGIGLHARGGDGGTTGVTTLAGGNGAGGDGVSTKGGTGAGVNGSPDSTGGNGIRATGGTGGGSNGNGGAGIVAHGGAAAGTGQKGFAGDFQDDVNVAGSLLVTNINANTTHTAAAPVSLTIGTRTFFSENVIVEGTGFDCSGATLVNIATFPNPGVSINIGTAASTTSAPSNTTIYGNVNLGTTTVAGDFTATQGNVTLGNTSIVGAFSKASGSFKIDHPLDPENKILYHSFVESPDMKNVYDGLVVLDEKGEATVELPAYFEALNRDFRYQLTCIGGAALVYVSKEIHDNRFSIAGGKPGLKVSWQVTGIRHDAWANSHRIQVEVEKNPNEKGKLLYGAETNAKHD
jgi:hypothetical protein